MIKIFLYLVIGIGVIFIAGLGILWLLPNYDVGIFRGRSMSPVISQGDFIVTGKPGKEVKPGMIVGYSLLDDRVPDSEKELIFHRVVLVDGQIFIAKGDANKEPDPWQIPIFAVKKIYLFKIPYLEYVASFMRTPFYWFFLTTLLLFCFILGRNKNSKKKG